VKTTGIMMSGNHPKLILDRIKTMTRRVITKHNSIIGEGGDWSKLDFEGKSVLSEDLKRIFTEEHERGSLAEKVIENNGRAPLPWVDRSVRNWWYLHVPYDWTHHGTIFRVYPKWEVGDRFWVRETFWLPADFDHSTIYYKVDWGNDKPAEMYNHNGKWCSSRFMPRWASRITLEITEVRVERLQEITEEDAKNEGVTPHRIDWDDNISPNVTINYREGFIKHQCQAWLWVGIKPLGMGNFI